MAIDWLVIWGVTKAAGALVKPVLKDFAEDIGKDTAKDLLKPYFGKIFDPLHQNTFEKAFGKAAKELLQHIDEELRNTGIPEHQTEAWAEDAKHFIRSEETQRALRQAFESSASTVDAVALRNGWPSGVDARLPDEFDWDYVAKSLSRRLKSLREDDPELRAALQAQASVETAANTRQRLGVQPDFELGPYREALLERYANLHFDTVDTSGANYSGVKLWSVFVPQTVRESREYLPQLHEIPKEHLRRLAASGGGETSPGLAE